MLQALGYVGSLIATVFIGVAPLVVDNPPEPEPFIREAPQQEVKEEKNIKKVKKWSELSVEEKIKRNPQKCDLSKQVMWGDGSCHDVVVPAPAPAPVATAAPTTAPVSGSCQDWMRAAGVPAGQFDAAYALIMRESGCNPSVYNHAGSGAGGIPQALPASKMGCAMDTSGAVCQIRWMIGYVNSRYGGFIQANAFQLANNWY